MDFVLIVQALVNIVDNALKYSPADTPVEICARRIETEVQIQVMDRGIGVPPDDLEHIFDKFYRVHRPDSVTGTGLGLAIAKGIVEAHGGRIWAESCPEGGTIITLTLPTEPDKLGNQAELTGKEQ
jgi:two-component system sensor histidine kinase KdpD